MGWLDTAAKMLVPPTGHDPALELAWRWRVAAFGTASFIGVALLYAALAYHWGLPDLIRPANAQEVRHQVNEVKRELGKQIDDVEEKLAKISSTQDELRGQQREDRLERVEQQLQWWRQQNCKSRGQARNYAWAKMGDLRQKYRDLAGTEWQMPTCSDIGAE